MTSLLEGTTTLVFAHAQPPRITAIVIVGTTCSGKTTLANAIRAAAVPGVDVPQRFVTRAPRADDVAAEAHTMTPAELDAAIVAGAIGLHWTRELEPGHVERYAFARPAADTLPVYSANNAICSTVEPPDALAAALVIGVRAPDATRAERLRRRSPGLVEQSPDEVRARLTEPISRAVHIVVDNSDERAAEAARDIVTLVRRVAQRR